MADEITREVPADAPVQKDWKTARLERFVKHFKSNGGDAEKAAIDAGDEWGEPLVIRKKVILTELADRLYKKAVSLGLLFPDKKYLKDVDVIPKEQLLSLLTQQARGERPTYRQEVLRKDPDTGLMEVVEVRSNFDEQKAQDLLAKILGLYEEAPKPSTVNVGVVIDGLKGWEKNKAEELLLEAHMQMLEATSLPLEAEVVEEKDEA